MPAPLSYADYAAREEQRAEKHAYLDGTLRARSGGTPVHARLASAFLRLVASQLGGRPCATHSSDLRIYVAVVNRSYYADGSVVCGKLETVEGDPHAVINPTPIVEVMSDGTLVEVHRREASGWSFHEFGAESHVDLTSIEVRISATELYRDPLAS